MQNILYYIIISLFTMSASWGQEKIRIAVLPFEGVQQEEGDLLARLLSQELVRGNLFEPLIRNEQDIISAMNEIKFQAIGLTENQQKARIGMAWNTKYILSGEVRTLGSKTIVSVSIFDVETLSTKTGDSEFVDGIEDIPDVFPKFVAEVGGFMRLDKDQKAFQNLLSLRRGQLGINEIQTLIARGFSAGNNQNKTPLMIASSYGYIEIVRYLLDEEVDINAKNINGVTALMYASQDGHFDIVYLLLNRGALPAIRSQQDNTAFSLADSNGHKEVASLLKKYRN